MHNNIMAASSRDRPPMLATRSYAQWQSRFLRYIDTIPNGDALRKCILEGSYQPTTVTIPVVPATADSPAVPEQTAVKTILTMSPENKAHYESEKEAIHLLLTGIGDEIYSTVDACKTAHEMWIAIERLQQGESLNIQDVKTNLFWKFGKFTSHDGESMESYYSRFYKMMNEMIRNNLTVATMQVNVQFLQQLQPEWSRFVTIVKQQHDLDTVSYHKLFDVLKQYQKEVNEIRAERIAKNANPLALVAAASPYPDPYYQAPKSHKPYAPTSKQSSSTRSNASTKFKGKDIAKPITPPSKSASEEDSDPEQAQRDKDMQKNLALIAKYFKKIYKPTNNNLRTSSNSKKQEGRYYSKVHNDAEYNVFANVRQHSEQPESTSNTCLVEKGDSNVTPDSLDMYDNDIQTDQNAKDERVALANLIANLKLDVDKNKKIQKQLKKANASLAHELNKCKSILAKTSRTLRESNIVKEKHDELVKQSLLTKSHYKGLVKEKTKVIMDLKLKEEKDIDKIISMEKQLKFLNEIVYKRNQSIQTIHMLAPKGPTFNGRPTFANPMYLKKAQSEKPCLYEILYDQSDPANRLVPDREETLTLKKESRSKLNKDLVRPYDYTKLNKLVDQAWEKHFHNHLCASTALDMEVLIETCFMPLAIKTQNDSFAFVHELKQEMHADLKYVESLENETDKLESDKAEFSNMYDILLQECVSNDVMCSYLHSLSDLDAHSKLQCLYIHKVKECECLAQKLSKQTESVSKEVYTELLQSFAKLEKHSISLELTLQQCQEQMKNDTIVQLILFFVDSGCTKHMTGNLTLMCNFVEKYMGTVHFGNDQFAPILGYRDLVQGNIMINRVYYIEGLNHNIFSGNNLLTGNRGSDLYTISLQETTSSTLIYLMAKASPTQTWLWHQILSHLNFEDINLLLKKDVMIGLPKLKYVKDQLCSSCEVSKAKRSLFKTKVVPSSKGRLNLLNMDLCGPMRVASINGKKYILVIVEDYSRYTWTLFLRSKDETPEVLKDFLTMIQQNILALVLSVRTDRGTEFLNKTLNAFFKEEGTEHQTSTGIVERRNRTLVEAARTMLSASKLLLFFWAEAIATACTSSVNKSSSPTDNSKQQDTPPITNNPCTTEPTTPTSVNAEENNENQAADTQF
ncbi:retrovirus-related pol polyprotein from transposon TNT 1-94 [Tanacetum coccineum]